MQINQSKSRPSAHELKEKRKIKQIDGCFRQINTRARSVVAVLLGVLLLVVLVEGEPSGAHGGDGGHLLLDPVAVLVLGVLLGLVLLVLRTIINRSVIRAESINRAHANA